MSCLLGAAPRPLSPGGNGAADNAGKASLSMLVRLSYLPPPPSMLYAMPHRVSRPPVTRHSFAHLRENGRRFTTSGSSPGGTLPLNPPQGLRRPHPPTLPMLLPNITNVSPRHCQCFPPTLLMLPLNITHVSPRHCPCFPGTCPHPSRFHRKRPLFIEKAPRFHLSLPAPALPGGRVQRQPPAIRNAPTLKGADTFRAANDLCAL